MTGARDINDFLTENPAQLDQIIDNTEPLSDVPAAEPPVSERLDQIISDWEQGKVKAIRTGIDRLDRALGGDFDGGGIYPHLIVMPALTGLGKTTFALQISNIIADQGKRVLFFSLEMPRSAIVAKSISFFTGYNAYPEYKRPSDDPGSDIVDHAKIIKKAKDREAKGPTGRELDEQNAVSTTNQIITGYRHRELMNGIRSNAVEYYHEAVQYYRDHIAPNFSIVEAGYGQYTIQDILDEVQKQQEAGTPPDFMVIDYLQLLGPKDPEKVGTSDKQRADSVISDLARLRGKLNIPILVISSINRQSYNSSIGLNSVKESGGIEYSAELIIGLQYRRKPGKDGKPEKDEGVIKEFYQAESGNWEKEVELSVIKARYGRPGSRVPFTFYPAANYYKEYPSEGLFDPDQGDFGEVVTAEDQSDDSDQIPEKKIISPKALAVILMDRIQEVSGDDSDQPRVKKADLLEWTIDQGYTEDVFLKAITATGVRIEIIADGKESYIGIKQRKKSASQSNVKESGSERGDDQ